MALPLYQYALFLWLLYLYVSKTLEAEISGRETRIQAVSTTAKRLCSEGHYASKIINQRSQGAQEKLHRLKQLSAARRQRLEEAVQAQQVILMVGCIVVRCVGEHC